MTDTIGASERSRIMSRVRAKDTRPEMLVRRLVHGAGYRYRLHGAKLPGKPDLVFASRRKVIFVHGCFWHRHDDCALARMPKSNQDFWVAKLKGTRNGMPSPVADSGKWVGRCWWFGNASYGTWMRCCDGLLAFSARRLRVYDLAVRISFVFLVNDDVPWQGGDLPIRTQCAFCLAE